MNDGQAPIEVMVEVINAPADDVPVDDIPELCPAITDISVPLNEIATPASNATEILNSLCQTSYVEELDSSCLGELQNYLNI